MKTLYEELIKETGLTKEHQHFFDSLQCSAIKVLFVTLLSNHLSKRTADNVLFLMNGRAQIKNAGARFSNISSLLQFCILGKNYVLNNFHRSYHFALKKMANVRYRVWSPSSRKQITGFYLTWIYLIDMIVEIYLLFYHFALYVLYKILLFEKCLCHLIQYDIITYKMNHFYIVWNDAIIDLFLGLDWLISMNIMEKKRSYERQIIFKSILQ